VGTGLRGLFIAVPLASAVAWLVFACGTSGTGQGGREGGGPPGGGGAGGSGSCLTCGTEGDGAACQGTHCAAADCSQSAADTTLTGHVYDPAGRLPLYNVYVYIPAATPAPIVPGAPGCQPCEAPASGSPMLGTSTLADGSFTLRRTAGDSRGVPVGGAIPLVLQVGKWRKQLVIPAVTACANNDLDAIFNAGSGTERQLRLPARSSEGDMPLIAFTSGCDPAECFLRQLGIDDSEFVAPGAPLPAPFPQVVPGAGHVHFYTGRDDQNGPSGSAVAGGNTPDDTYAWWSDPAQLLQYDIVFNACECNPNDRGAGAYAAMDAFLNQGGRLFTTHYYGNWFVPSTATADLQSVAQWSSFMPSPWSGNSPISERDTVDQSFPKGQAYAEWLDDNHISNSMGNITLSDLRDDVLGANPAGCSAAGGSCLSTRWLYNPGDDHPRYLSFNTPVGLPASSQCGRAMYSDVHLSGVSDDSVFPLECDDPGIDDPPGHAVNERALEFLFFDLSSCVQNDLLPPLPPGTSQ
jgi:hypothetical protein